MQLARLRATRRAELGRQGRRRRVLALRLEAHLSKQQILEQYLNRVELGQGTIGIAAASALYFNTSPSEVSIGQAATLAGLAHAPSRDNPHVSLERARARRSTRARANAPHGLRDARRGCARTRRAARERRASAPFLAPHFTTHVLAWTPRRARRDAHARMRTSLDVGLQTELEAEVRHTVDALHDRGVGQAAVVVLDNATGEVLAWVGSPDFWASENGQTDMVVVAAPARLGAQAVSLRSRARSRHDRGDDPARHCPSRMRRRSAPIVRATTIGGFADPCARAKRSPAHTTCRRSSLASRLGAPSLLQTLHLAGLLRRSTRDAEYYGLGLALGNGDVTLIELANGYRALANGGEWRPWTWRPVCARRGASTAERRRVMSPVASAIVLDILSDPAARMPGFGFETPFDFPFPVAVKTGTSRHFTDNWAVGTTRGFTVAVWAGNFNGHPMEGVSGVTGAGPLLHRAVMARREANSAGRAHYAGRSWRGRGASVPAVWHARDAEVREAHRVVRARHRADASPTTGRRAAGRVPDEYAEWAHGGLSPAIAEPATARVSTPSLPVPRHVAKTDSVPAFRIMSPLNGDRYAVPPGVEAKYASIPLRAGGPGADRVSWTVDGKSYAGERWSLAPGEHVISAKSTRGDAAAVRIVVDR